MGDELIPERFRAKCDFCGRVLDTRADGVHQYTSGWVKNRSGGGGHGISLPERVNRWAHDHCVNKEAHGFTNQEKLL